MMKRWTTPSTARSGVEPPRIGGSTPFGCAFQYRRDPVGFLRKAQARVGDVFTLDLAGLEITLIANPEKLTIYHAASEATLSARSAQSDIGFGRVLGEINVHTAADVHRRLLGPDRKHWAEGLGPRLWSQTQLAIDVWGARSAHPDLLTWMRALATRVVLGVFVSAEVLERTPAWADAYARFQDRLERAIARALVLPRWIGDPLLLRPVERARAGLVHSLASVLRSAEQPAPYLVQLRHALGEDSNALRQSEVAIGLLFAAYKNPSIGAAQTLLMLLSHPRWLELVRAELDGCRGKFPNLRELPHLDGAIRETLRLCALTIGSLRRVTARPFVLGEHTLPVGRFVGASHILMSMRKDAWPEPETFDPARFFAERPRLPVVPNAWLPFSSGVHGCPGYRVALDFIACLVAATLDRFPALRLAGPLPRLDFERATLAQRARPCPVQLLES